MSELTIIVASHWQQALLVAEKLGLEREIRDPRSSVVYIGPEEHHRVMGSLPTRVVFARPILRSRGKQLETEQLVGYRAARSSVEPEFVRT